MTVLTRERELKLTVASMTHKMMRAMDKIHLEAEWSEGQ